MESRTKTISRPPTDFGVKLFARAESIAYFLGVHLKARVKEVIKRTRAQPSSECVLQDGNDHDCDLHAMLHVRKDASLFWMCRMDDVYEYKNVHRVEDIELIWQKKDKRPYFSTEEIRIFNFASSLLLSDDHLPTIGANGLPVDDGIPLAEALANHEKFNNARDEQERLLVKKERAEKIKQRKIEWIERRQEAAQERRTRRLERALKRAEEEDEYWNEQMAKWSGNRVEDTSTALNFDRELDSPGPWNLDYFDIIEELCAGDPDHPQTKRIREFARYLKAELYMTYKRPQKIADEVLGQNGSIDRERLYEWNLKEGADVLFEAYQGEPGYVSVLGTNERHEKLYDPVTKLLYPGTFSLTTKRFDFGSVEGRRPNVFRFIICDRTRLVQCEKIAERLAMSLGKTTHEAKVTLVQGVPGCGKTTEIIGRAKEKDLILTVGKNTRASMNRRMRAKRRPDKMRAYTVDSFLVNDWDESYETVWLDEGLMLHAGMLDVIAILTGCKNLYVYGDRKQIPFINRIRALLMEHQHYNFGHNVEIRNVTYRCPKSVARLFDQDYAELGGMRSQSEEEGTLECRALGRPGELEDLQGKWEREGETKIICFTQMDKHILIARGFTDANTVHEVQGESFDNVILVRIDDRDLPLFTSDPHVLVAMTRHRKRFTYLTRGRLDPESDGVINKLRQSPTTVFGP